MFYYFTDSSLSDISFKNVPAVRMNERNERERLMYVNHLTFARIFKFCVDRRTFTMIFGRGGPSEQEREERSVRVSMCIDTKPVREKFDDI